MSISKDKSQIELSIVCSVYNDAELVPILVRELKRNADELSINYEILLVNDSSTDNSEQEIEKVCNNDKNVKGLSLARNFGQHIAISVGMRYASGKFVLIMDGDLQNPPSEIPRLYSEILKGFDVVYTVYKERNNNIDKLTSIFFWFVITKIFNVKIVKNQLTMKIMTSELVKKFNNYEEVNRTIEGIINDISVNYSVLEVKNESRKVGSSHYTFFSRFNLFIDYLVCLSNAPLNMMIILGLFVFVITILISIYFIIVFIFADVPIGYTSVILSIFFFGSLIILLLGFIGKYLSNIYMEVRKRPMFHIKTMFNF